jgi:hypothetical protein
MTSSTSKSVKYTTFELVDAPYFTIAIVTIYPDHIPT